MSRVVAVLGGALLAAVLSACSPPMLSEVQEQVFTPSCVFSTCHDAANPERGMSLEAGESYASLVGAEAQESGWTRVVPGEPEQSLLYAVLGGPVGDTDAMPTSFALPSAEMELVRGWIAGGALTD